METTLLLLLSFNMHMRRDKNTLDNAHLVKKLVTCIWCVLDVRTKHLAADIMQLAAKSKQVAVKRKQLAADSK